MEKQQKADEYTVPITVAMQVHRVSRNVIYQWIERGKLEAIKKGQPLTWYFKPDQVEQLRQERVATLEIKLARIQAPLWEYL